MFLRNQVEKRVVLENLDLDLLCLDETMDERCVTQLSHPQRAIHLTTGLFTSHLQCRVETDSTTITSQVSLPKADTAEIVICEQTIMNASRR